MNRPSTTSYTCFSSAALRPGGMLLHLSTGCNMHCRYCFEAREPGSRRSLDTAGATILTVESAFDMVCSRVERGSVPSVVEIGGPGEPLLNPATYVVLRQLYTVYPDLPLSVWTNGVLLRDRLEELVRLGVGRVTLSLPAASLSAAERIYDQVIYRCRRFTGGEAAELALRQQWNGLENAVDAGLSVTAYVAGVPGVNDHELAEIRRKAEQLGAADVIVHPLP